jgi:arylsulfatase A-like enzyme
MKRIVLALLLSMGASCRPAAPSHIVLISIDSLRADHLGAYGYERNTSPHIDALAGQGALFERAVSSTSWTLPAHVALFTGLADGIHGVQRANLALGPGLPTLAERLQAAGYHTAAIVSGPFFAPEFGLDRGFDEYLNCMSYLDDQFQPRSGRPLNPHRASHYDVTGPCVVRRARAWLSRNRDRRGFLFVHFWDVHYDYNPPAGYAERFDPDYAGRLDGRNFRWNPAIRPDMDPRDLEHLIALYDGEIAATDAHVGELLATLDELDVARSTLVVLTSDHGDAFFEHGEKGHQKDLHRESVSIPLMLRGPGVPVALRHPGPAHITDIGPTILDLAGAEAPGLGEGKSLVPAFGDPSALRERWLLSELDTTSRHHVALESLDRKVVRDLREGTTRAYDLGEDPGEAHAVPPSLDLIEVLEARMGQVGERARSAPPPVRAKKVAPETKARLRALGYLE